MSASPSLMEILQENLPVLQVILPLMAAPICVLVRRAKAAWLLATGATWMTFAISWSLLQTVLAEGLISYDVGDWPPPWGIELRIEPVNALVLLIVSGIGAIVISACPRSLDAEVPPGRHYLFHAAFLLCMTGLLGMASAGDAFNVFVFLEISSLSSYSLIALGRHRRALTASFRYLVLGTVGGTSILLGVGLLYMSTGTLNMADLAGRLADVGPTRTVMVALVAIVVGATLKLALLPLGAWLPNAYTFAPSMVTAFLAATATKVAFYVLARFVYRVFGPALSFDTFHLDGVLLPLALFSMVAGAALAVFERDVKRLLAYSSLSQIGYMTLGLSLASLTGLTGGLVHLLNHALMKSGLFMVVACVVLRTGSSRLSAFRGLGKRMPLTMAAFVAGGLSLIGVPLTVGFISKWFLVKGALEQELWPVAALILLSSLLAIIYIWKIVEAIYFGEPDPDLPEATEAPWQMLVPTWLLVGGAIYFGIFARPTTDLAAAAASFLLGGTP